MERVGSPLTGKFFLAILWLGFIGLWYRVYRITPVSDVTDSITYIGSIMSAYGLIVTVWVFHNIAIYRRKGPRRGVRVMNFAGTHDALHRYIMSKVDLKKTQAITINIVDGRKFFVESKQPKRDLVAGI